VPFSLPKRKWATITAPINYSSPLSLGKPRGAGSKRGKAAERNFSRNRNARYSCRPTSLKFRPVESVRATAVTARGPKLNPRNKAPCTHASISGLRDGFSRAIVFYQNSGVEIVGRRVGRLFVRLIPPQLSRFLSTCRTLDEAELWLVLWRHPHGEFDFDICFLCATFFSEKKVATLPRTVAIFSEVIQAFEKTQGYFLEKALHRAAPN